MYTARITALSRGAVLLVAGVIPLVVVAAGCEDSSSSDPSNPVFEAAAFDGPTSDGPSSTADGSDGATGDGGGGDADASQPYSPKAACDAPLKVVDYSGNDFASAPVFASAPGSPVVAFFNRVVNATSDVDCELRTLSGATWGGATTVQATTCSAITPFQLAAGGNAALAAWTSASVSGQRRRVPRAEAWTSAARRRSPATISTP